MIQYLGISKAHGLYSRVDGGYPSKRALSHGCFPRASRCQAAVLQSFTEAASLPHCYMLMSGSLVKAQLKGRVGRGLLSPVTDI